MNQLYHISQLRPNCHRDSGCGFNIALWPAWKDAIAAYSPKLTQKAADTAVGNLAEEWLTGCGFNPEIYLPHDMTAIRVKWGEWGPEHITVPGSACGLDIDDGLGRPCPGGKVLLPHNVDSIRQAHLLLTVFSFFADTLVTDQILKECRRPT